MVIEPAFRIIGSQGGKEIRQSNDYTFIYGSDITVNIEDSIITGNGAFNAPEANGNGGESTGDAIILDSKTTYAVNMVLKISGENTTISSTNGYAVQETLTDAQKAEVEQYILNASKKDEITRTITR